MRNVMKKNLLKVLLMASVLSVSPVVTAESNVVYAAENEYILPDSDSSLLVCGSAFASRYYTRDFSDS